MSFCILKKITSPRSTGTIQMCILENSVFCGVTPELSMKRVTWRWGSWALTLLSFSQRKFAFSYLFFKCISVSFGQCFIWGNRFSMHDRYLFETIQWNYLEALFNSKDRFSMTINGNIYDIQHRNTCMHIPTYIVIYLYTTFSQYDLTCLIIEIHIQ